MQAYHGHRDHFRPYEDSGSDSDLDYSSDGNISDAFSQCHSPLPSHPPPRRPPSTPPARNIRLLYLSFEFTDLHDVEEQRREIMNLAEEKGIKAEHYAIPIRQADAQEELNARLDEFLESGDKTTLLLIYYSGHGGMMNHRGGELVLAR